MSPAPYSDSDSELPPVSRNNLTRLCRRQGYLFSGLFNSLLSCSTKQKKTLNLKRVLALNSSLVELKSI